MSVRLSDLYRRIAAFHMVNLIAAITDDAAYVRTARHSSAVRDAIHMGISKHSACKAAHDIAAGNGAADEGDIMDDRIMEYAKKANIDGICPVDIQIEDIVIKAIEFPMETIFSIFDNNLPIFVTTDGLKSSSAVPILRGGGIDAVAEGVVAAEVRCPGAAGCLPPTCSR